MLSYRQHTITKSVSLSGIGLHTGISTIMKLLPAPPNHGIKFRRIDMPGSPIVDADCDNVVDVSRGTTIEQSGARIATIEHTLAAITGMEIDNVLIEIDGPEAPIMDGSSIQFVEILKEAGKKEQDAFRNFYKVQESIVHKESKRGVEIAALPLDDFRVTVMIDYNSPVLGSQYAFITNIDQFEKEIASSRTFCFLREIEMLYQNNLIKGGDLSNAIVIVDRVVKDSEMDKIAQMMNKPKITVKEGTILNNTKLRHQNEPARHKLLDVVGDLMLVGRPLKAQILATRPGHAANVAFAKKIKEAMLKENKSKAPSYDVQTTPLFDVHQIAKILPHRYPFLLVDKIMHMDEKNILGIKNVTANEPFFSGHFPNNMVMPGVLLAEAMAQTGAILLLNSIEENPEKYWAYFLGIESFRFKKMVRPGDTLTITCNLMSPIRRGIAKMHGCTYVGDTLACEGTVIASIVKKER